MIRNYYIFGCYFRTRFKQSWLIRLSGEFGYSWHHWAYKRYGCITGDNAGFFHIDGDFQLRTFCQLIGRQDAPNARVEWMSASTRRLYSNIQGDPFLATQGLESCSKLTFIFVRTFPAAIAGRGDYFHYDIETKEAVRYQILFHIMNIRFMKTSFYNAIILTLIFKWRLHPIVTPKLIMNRRLKN